MFYVLTALRALLRERGRFAGSGEPNLAVLLDLVALGTVADVVQLDHINRILVGQGLLRIRAGRSQPGLRALFAAAGCDPARATAYDLGFVIGPRLNAAGRLADMSVGITCLLADDETSAAPFAAELDRLNRERREVEATMHDEALAGLDETIAADRYTLCVYRPEWHQGVVGIVRRGSRSAFTVPRSCSRGLPTASCAAPGERSPDSSARRAGSRRQTRPRNDRAVRRPRVRRGVEPRGSRAPSIHRRVRARGAGVAIARGSAADA